MAVTVARPGRPAVACPAALTVTTLASVLLQATPVAGAPATVTVNGNVSPARSTERVAVTCRAPEGEVGVVVESSQPAEVNRARTARATAAREDPRKRDVTARL